MKQGPESLSVNFGHAYFRQSIAGLVQRRKLIQVNANFLAFQNLPSDLRGLA